MRGWGERMGLVCLECGGKLRVVDSRPLQGGVWRRRKCAKGHLSYTQELFVEKKAGIKKTNPRPRKVRPPEPKPFGPALEEWNIVVTKNSPLWLRSIAMQLG